MPLYDEDIQDIMGKIPGKIIHFGITVIFLVILGLIIGSYFIRYPDIVKADIVLSLSCHSPVIPIGEDCGLAGDSQLKGKAYIHMKNIGKISEGQNVVVKLESFPVLEFGVMRGIIGKISDAPEKNRGYIAEVIFPNGAITSYHKEIKIRDGMEGTAEIMTKEERLLAKLMAPLKVKRNEGR